MSVTFGIVMTTYYRKNGSTLQKITRAINSIKNQTHKDWKLFLIGDNYQNNEEFELISSLLPKEKITASPSFTLKLEMSNLFNLSMPKE